MKKRLDFVVKKLEVTEKTSPDPSAVSYDLAQEISASGFDASDWSSLLARFAHSPSSAVSAALAWALVDDAKGSSRVDLASVLRFADAVESLDHPGLSGGVLAAVADRLPRAGVELGSDDAGRLKELLLRCFEPTGQFQVEICILDVLERLSEAGAIALVFGQEGLAEVVAWLRSFAEREVDGPFAETAGSLLAALDPGFDAISE